MSTSVKSMLETVERVFQATHVAVSALQDGQRMQVKELAQSVSLTVGMEPKYVLPFVNHYVHHTNVVYVTRGKKGGVVKGVRPAKQVKAGKKTNVSPAND